MTEIKFDDPKALSRHLLVSTCVVCSGSGYEWKRKTGYVAEVLGLGKSHGWQACWMCEGFGTTFSQDNVRKLLDHKHQQPPK